MCYPCINKQNPMILASASPRRKDLLEQAGLPFKALSSHITEDGLDEDPEQTTCHLAEKKACEVYSRISGSWTLGADTLVVIDAAASEKYAEQNHPADIILGKPKDATEAGSMLRLLNGKEHRVITGFCILDPSGKPVHSEAVSTVVSIKKLSKEEITAYINTKEPFGKAGAYAIQGIGSFMVKSISGSYTNVVGLPLYALIRALISAGALKRFPLLPD